MRYIFHTAILLLPLTLFAASQSIPYNESGHHLFNDIVLQNHTAGAVLHVGSDGRIDQDETVLFWDDTNNRLGVGTNAPSTDLHVQKAIAGGAVDARVYNNDSDGIGHIYAGSNGGGHINLIANSGSTTYLGISANTSGLSTEFSDLVIAAGSGGSATELMRFKDSGEIGIGDDSADYGLEIATTTSNGYFAVTNISDGDIFSVNQGGDTTFVNGFADAIGIGTTTFGSNALLAVEDGTIEWTWGNHEIDHSTPGGDTGFIFNGSQLGNFSRFDIKNTDNATVGNRYFSLAFNGQSGLVIAHDGDVGIGSTDPTVRLFVESSATANVMEISDETTICGFDPEPGQLDIPCPSDARLKENIVDAPDFLQYILDIPIRQYNLIGEDESDLHYTPIAQELLETHPDLVSMGEDGYYSIETNLTWKIIKAMQEMYEELSQENAELRARLDALESKIPVTAH